jgi:hypothetical protein
MRVALCGAVAAGLLAAAIGTSTATATNAEPSPASPLPQNDAALAPHRPGVVLIGYAAGTSEARKQEVRGKVRSKSTKRLSPKHSGVDVVQLADGETVVSAMRKIRSESGVRYVEPDYVLAPAATSDDPQYTNGSLWGMYGDGTSPANQFGSGAGEAWSAGFTGSRSVAIGIIDEGVQITHPDLAANIWTNPDEIAGNGVDDDSNGYIDDINGWDFINNNATVYDGNSTEGSDTHGTHVAGTIGGVGGNGAGVAGVNWAVTLIPAKFLGPSGGYTSDAARAVDYLTSLKVSKGVNIVATSNSWGGGGASTALLDAINRAGDRGILFVAAAGNSSSDNDSVGSYPSNYQCTNNGTRGWDCVIAVASITSSGTLSGFSSYGATTVDIAAPGSAVTSTYPVNSYASLSGTSMATPHVSGAIALCASANPSLTAQQLRAALLSSAQPTASLAGKVVNGGRLDVGALLSQCAPPTAPVTGAPTGLTATATSAQAVQLNWTDGASNETSYVIARAPSTNNVCGTFTNVGDIASNSTSFLMSGLTAATTYCFRVTATNNFGGGSFAASNDASARTLDPPAAYTCTSITGSWVARGTATNYTLTDDSQTNVTLPFAFTYYGTTFTNAQISSNGYLRLGNGAATAFTNASIPSAGDPDGIIAPWWDDLDPALGGTIWSQTVGSAPNRQFVVTWDGIYLYLGGTSGLSFQVVLDEATRAITFQYADVTGGVSTGDAGASATVGVESVEGMYGTQFSLNQAVLSNGLAIRCTDVTVPIPSITTTSLPAGTVGVSYSQTLAATSGTAPMLWSISSGSLPAGLSLDPGTGVISGNPTTAATASFTAKVTDANGQTSSRSLSIAVAAPVSITTASLPTGSVGTAYSQTPAATGGTTPYTWSLSTGTLPAGLSLTASSGRVSGTPTTAGTSNFELRATDSLGRTATRSFSITINGAIPGTFNKVSPSNGASSRPRNGLVLSWGAATGATSYEYCIDTSRNGTCNATWISVGSATSTTLNGLLLKTTYEWQVRAVNTSGTRLANNGSWWRFTTVNV